MLFRRRSRMYAKLLALHLLEQQYSFRNVKPDELTHAWTTLHVWVVQRIYDVFGCVCSPATRLAHIAIKHGALVVGSLTSQSTVCDASAIGNLFDYQTSPCISLSDRCTDTPSHQHITALASSGSRMARLHVSSVPHSIATCDSSMYRCIEVLMYRCIDVSINWCIEVLLDLRGYVRYLSCYSSISKSSVKEIIDDIKKKNRSYVFVRFDRSILFWIFSFKYFWLRLSLTGSWF